MATQSGNGTAGPAELDRHLRIGETHRAFMDYFLGTCVVFIFPTPRSRRVTALLHPIGRQGVA
jgi:hypothetical protein